MINSESKRKTWKKKKKTEIPGMDLYTWT
jgi:hypothetical protein